MAQSHDPSVDHLTLAKQYIAIAESADSKREAYMKAADEIIAAQTDDPTLGRREIARSLGRVKSYVDDLVRWRTSGRAHGLPFQRDAKDTHEIRQQRDAAKVLAEAPMEDVERLVMDLPPARQRAVAKALEGSHPAVQSKPPLDMPEPNAGYLTRMAGPITNLRGASKQFIETHKRYADGADQDELESVRDDVADIVSELSAVVADWSLS